MRFLLDESADLPLARSLQSLGHDVTAIVRDYQRGQLDPAVLALALQEQRILITNDGDVRALVLERHLPHAGVIWLRLNDESLSAKRARLEEVLQDHQNDLANHRFLEVTADTVSILV